MKRFFAALTVVTLLSTGSLFAQPQDPGGMKKHHQMFADLNLSDAQQQQLKALHEEMQVLRKKHMESVKTVRDKMKAELLKPDASQNVLYGYAGELGELHKQMSKDRSDHLLKVKKILSSEQFAKLVEREERMGPGKDFGPDGCGKCPNNGQGCTHKDGAKCQHDGQGCMHKGGAKCPHAGVDASQPPQGGCPHHSAPASPAK